MIDSKVPSGPFCGLNVVLGFLGAFVAMGIDSPLSYYFNTAFYLAIALSSISGALIAMYGPLPPWDLPKTHSAIFCEICAILLTASIGSLILFKLPNWL